MLVGQVSGLGLLRLRLTMTERLLTTTRGKVPHKMVRLGIGSMLEVTYLYSNSGSNLAPCTMATISITSGLTRYTMR